MHHNMIKIVFIGDTFTKLGIEAIEYFLPKLIEDEGVSFTVCNGENSAGGLGLTKKYAKRLINAGVDVITMGNHTFGNSDIFKIFDFYMPVIRPYNLKEYPLKGKEDIIIEKNGLKFGVINPIGNIFLEKIVSGSPFSTIVDRVEHIRRKSDIVIVDFHAEATSEKKAMGYLLDGTVTAVLGSHTHIQTADEQILPKGTAYITDAGMTGPQDSVIGIKKELVIKRMVTKEFVKYEPAKGDVKLHGVIIEVDKTTGLSKSIKRLQLSFNKSCKKKDRR